MKGTAKSHNGPKTDRATKWLNIKKWLHLYSYLLQPSKSFQKPSTVYHKPCASYSIKALILTWIIL